MNKDWITINQAAQELNVCIDTIRRWCKKGVLVSKKIGPSVYSKQYVSRESVEKMISPPQ